MFWTSLVAAGQRLRQTDEPRPSPAASLPRLRHEAALTLLPALVVVAFCVLLLAVDPGFFWRDDYQSYQLAGFCDMARAWSEGEFPLLSPYSWQAGALAGEYQNGVFSIFLTGCVVIVFGLGLSLPAAAAVLSVVHLAVLAAGTFRLARRQGLAPDLAMLAALVAAVNGWIVLWGATAWFPALASFAWVPWVWWGLDRALDPRGGPARFVPAGLFLYLVVTAGWPFTVLIVGVLTAWLLAKAGWERGGLAGLWPVAAAWGVGLGLSAPAWLMLVEYTRHTTRAHTPAALTREWMVPLAALPGLVFPQWFAFWKGFGGAWKPHLSAELAGGLVPVAVLGAALASAARPVLCRLRWELGLCAAALLLTVSPGFGNFRWSFRWLPLFFLALGLTAAHALALLRARQDERSSAPEGGAPRPWTTQLFTSPALWASYLVLVIWARAMLVGLGPACVTFVFGLLLAFLCLAWAKVESGAAPGSALRAWAPCGVVFLSCWVTYAGVGRFLEVPAWKFGERHRTRRGLDPSLQYLSVHTMPDVIGPAGGVGPDLFPGNSSMYAGLRCVNGYSPMGPLGLTGVFDFGFHGFVTPTAGARLLIQETRPDGLLQLMGVDGLIVSDAFEEQWPTVEANGWRLEEVVEGGAIFYRQGPASPRVRTVERAERTGDLFRALDLLTEPREGPVPLVLLGAGGRADVEPLHFAPARVTPVEESRGRVVVEVAGSAPDREALVVFARPWFPGYRATLDGRPVPVEVLDLTMPAVRVPAGAERRLVLEYRPRSLVLGCWLAAAAGAAVLLVLGLQVVPGRLRPGADLAGPQAANGEGR